MHTFYMTRPQQTLHTLADSILPSTSLSSWRPIIWHLGDADSAGTEHQTTPYTCCFFPVSDILLVLFFFERNKITILLVCICFLFWLALHYYFKLSHPYILRTQQGVRWRTAQCAATGMPETDAGHARLVGCVGGDCTQHAADDTSVWRSSGRQFSW